MCRLRANFCCLGAFLAVLYILEWRTSVCVDSDLNGNEIGRGAWLKVTSCPFIQFSPLGYIQFWA